MSSRTESGRVSHLLTLLDRRSAETEETSPRERDTLLCTDSHGGCVREPVAGGLRYYSPYERGNTVAVYDR